jgi:uncharacterized protein (DUF302 family)
MLQFHSTHGMEQIEVSLRQAAERHGGSVLAVGAVGDALAFTLCFSKLYEPLLGADIRFSAVLPCRVAAWAKAGGVMLEAVSPRESCRLLHRPELEPLAAPLEEMLRRVMEEAAHRTHAHGDPAEHPATEDQVNMRAALPQRLDCHGTKVEELAGTGVHDAQGG